MRTIILVDEAPAAPAAWTTALPAGCALTLAHSLNEARDALKAPGPRLILANLDARDLAPDALVRAVRLSPGGADRPIVFFTHAGRDRDAPAPDAPELLSLGADDVALDLAPNAPLRLALPRWFPSNETVADRPQAQHPRWGSEADAPPRFPPPRKIQLEDDSVTELSAEALQPLPDEDPSIESPSVAPERPADDTGPTRSAFTPPGLARDDGAFLRAGLHSHAEGARTADEDTAHRADAKTFSGPVALEPVRAQRGHWTHPLDAPRHLLRFAQSQATGQLKLGDATTLVFRQGALVDLSGPAPCEHFRELLADFSHIAPKGRIDRLFSPTAVTLRLMEQGRVEPADGVSLLSRLFEDTVVNVLRFRGPFEVSLGALAPGSGLPEADDFIGLLRRALIRSVEPARYTERAPPRIDDVPPVHLDRKCERFLDLLDGRRPVEAAARLMALPAPDAWALVILAVAGGCGRIEFEENAPPRPQAERAPAPAPTGARLAEQPAEARLVDLRARVETGDHLSILGVSADATLATIDAAHQRLIGLVPLPHHLPSPELVAQAEEILLALDESRNVLTEPELREAYLMQLTPPTPSPRPNNG